MKLLIKRLKEIQIVCEGTVGLKNAGQSNVYFDIKKAYGHPDALRLICDALWQKIDKKTTCIATSGYGGMSPATLLAVDYDKKLTLIRDEPKKYGLNKLIEGYVPTKNDKVAIIDDVLTTGKTLEKAIETVQATGAEVSGCYVIVKRGDVKLSAPLQYLLTPQDFD